MSADVFFIDATDLLGPEQSDKVAAINRRSVGSSAKWRNYSSSSLKAAATQSEGQLSSVTVIRDDIRFIVCGLKVLCA